MSLKVINNAPTLTVWVVFAHWMCNKQTKWNFRLSWVLGLAKQSKNNLSLSVASRNAKLIFLFMKSTSSARPLATCKERSAQAMFTIHTSGMWAADWSHKAFVIDELERGFPVNCKALKVQSENDSGDEFVLAIMQRGFDQSESSLPSTIDVN